jgi:hypothetical protein
VGLAPLGKFQFCETGIKVVRLSLVELITVRQNTTGEYEYIDFNLFMFYLLSIATRAVDGGSDLGEK